MNHSLGISSSGEKFALHLVHFMSTFELQLQKATKFLSYFGLHLVRKKSTKKPCPLFLITFFFFFFVEILVYITYLFPLNWGIKNMVLLSGNFPKCKPLLRELHPRFFELVLEYCTLTENLHRRRILFHWYCNFNPPTRLNDIWYCGIPDVLARTNSFNLFFVWKF